MSATLNQTEAIAQFITATDSDDIAAEAYLPAAYDHCDKCVTRETHGHPMARQITTEQFAEAVSAYQYSQWCIRNDV